MAASGTTTINFGAVGSINHNPTVAITGQTSILSGSLVEAWIWPVATSDHTVDEHTYDVIKVTARDVVAGTGFTIFGECLQGIAYGSYTVAWAWA
jgi:hypothetical protein